MSLHSSSGEDIKVIEVDGFSVKLLQAMWRYQITLEHLACLQFLLLRCQLQCNEDSSRESTAQSAIVLKHSDGKIWILFVLRLLLLCYKILSTRAFNKLLFVCVAVTVCTGGGPPQSSGMIVPYFSLSASISWGSPRSCLLSCTLYCQACC